MNTAPHARGSPSASACRLVHRRSGHRTSAAGPAARRLCSRPARARRRRSPSSRSSTRCASSAGSKGRPLPTTARYADDRHQDLPRLAAELVARKPDLIYAPPMVGAWPRKQATRTIPIVFAAGKRPGGRRPGRRAWRVRAGTSTGVISAQRVARAQAARTAARNASRRDTRRRSLSDPTERDVRGRPHRGSRSRPRRCDLTIVVGRECRAPVELDAAVGQADRGSASMVDLRRRRRSSTICADG